MGSCVSFDLDGVLMRNPFELGVEPYVVAHVLADASRRPAGLADDAPPDETAVRRAIDGGFLRRLRAGGPAAYDWDAIYGEVAAGFGATPPPPVEDLVRRFTAEPGMVATHPGAFEALALVREAGLRCIAVTNGFSTFQRPVLAALGLDAAFDALVSPLETGTIKPDPGMFRGLGGLVAHLGDTLWHDVLGARRARIDALWVHPRAPEPATADAGVLRAHVWAVAPGDPHAGIYGGVATDDLVPHVGGRRPDAVVATWLEGRGSGC